MMPMAMRLAVTPFDRQKWLQHVPENGLLYLLEPSDSDLKTLNSDGTDAVEGLGPQQKPFSIDAVASRKTAWSHFMVSNL